MELIKTQNLLVKGANTKTEVELLADYIITKMEEEGGVIDLAVTVAATDHLIKSIKSNTRYTEAVQLELSYNGGKSASASGARIETMEGGTKYHFDKCGDWELAMLEQQELSAANAVKGRKEFLKTVPAAGIEAVTPDGEVVRLYPPYKTSTTTYKVTLAK